MQMPFLEMSGLRSDIQLIAVVAEDGNLWRFFCRPALFATDPAAKALSPISLPLIDINARLPACCPAIPASIPYPPRLCSRGLLLGC